MAIFYAEQAFNYTNLNLNRLVANQTDFDFQDNVNITFNGRVYQDVVSFQHYSGGYVATTFGGNGITFSANYQSVTGGTVTGVTEQYWTGTHWLDGWWLEGFSFSAVSLANAANTSGTADDYAAIQAILSGSDRINLSDFSDKMTGYAGNDSIFGFGGNDTLLGESGNDSLDGGTGADQLFGGAGNDTYRIDSAADRIYETATTTSSVDLGGKDTVQAVVTFALPSFVEDLVLGGSSAISGAGNSLSNKITGNAGSNALSGSGGNDTLSGGNGNDLLDGGSGNDSMTGGAGNDRYVVNASGDKVIEVSGGGSDSVTSSISYTLPSHVEKLTLTGSSNINGTGNTSSNTITGNSKSNSLSGGDGNDNLYGADGNDTLSGGNGNDLLDGGNGNDSMSGGAGNDRYVVNSSGDKVIEASGGGSDSVSSSISYTLPTHVESLMLTGSGTITGTGNTSNNKITGNSKANSLSGADGNDSLIGMDGNDSLVGGTGNDTLTGGAGLDTFRFSSALNTTNVDTITDFNPADDILQLENNVFTKLTSTGVLSASNFRASTTGNAADSNDFVLYNTATGQLFHDADGSGAGAKVLIATLSSLPVLTAGDIFVT